jgi:hypothetical protein
VVPNHSPIEGGIVVTVTGNFFIEGLDCVFSSPSIEIRQPATLVNSTQITCTTPAWASEEALTLSVFYLTRQYLINTMSFTFVHCPQYDSCESCQNDPFGLCGWCLTGPSTCEPSYFCPTNTTWERIDCPRILGINPSIGPIEGGTTVTVNGILFIDHPDLIVRFGGLEADDVQFINSTSLSCVTPPQDEAGEVEVDMFLIDKPYTDVFRWNYIKENDGGSNGGDGGLSSSSIGVIAGVVSVGFLAILAAVIAFLVYRRKVMASKIILIDPKYDEIAFGNFLTAQYVTDKQQMIDMMLLEELLLSPEKTLVVAISKITQATESDNLAKSLVYIFEDKGKMIDLMLTFIEIELASGESNTVFRQNSLATKMFKFYSRMVGIGYLFNTLARYVAELDVSSKQKTEENEILTSTIDIEVDPTKISEGDENINTLQLMLVVQKLFNAIMKSSKNIPL